MDAANQRRTYVIAILLCGLGYGSPFAYGQSSSVRTQNFVVSAPSPALAKAVGDAAEQYRSQLAEYWLGYELAPWENPCPIRVVEGPQLAAQGVTHYDIQPVRNFRMEVVGSSERILDSVLPHEITHTILATHFKQPLPRWADEGVCTIVEHHSEKSKHESHLREFLRSQRGIAMNKLFLLREYPTDIHPMYAQGYSVCRFLVEQGGPRVFMQFLGDYIQQRSWTDSVQKHYQYESLAELQQYWLKWVADGSRDARQYVKAPRPNADSDIVRVASASTPLGSLAPSEVGPATGGGDAPATVRAARDAGSWYHSQRDQIQPRSPGASQPKASVDSPYQPTIRPRQSRPQPHTVAQPQPEQGMAPSPQWPVPSSGSTNTSGASTIWR